MQTSGARRHPVTEEDRIDKENPWSSPENGRSPYNPRLEVEFRHKRPNSKRQERPFFSGPVHRDLSPSTRTGIMSRTVTSSTSHLQTTSLLTSNDGSSSLNRLLVRLSSSRRTTNLPQNGPKTETPVIPVTPRVSGKRLIETSIRESRADVDSGKGRTPAECGGGQQRTLLV